MHFPQMLPVNYCPGFTSLKLYGHVKFSISIMYALCIATHYILTLLFLCSNFKLSLLLSPYYLLIFPQSCFPISFFYTYSVSRFSHHMRCSKYSRFLHPSKGPLQKMHISTFIAIQQNSHKTHYM